MPPLSPSSINELQEKLGEALMGSIRLPAAERPVYIGRHLLAALDGVAPPASLPLSLPAAQGRLGEDLPQLEALLSKAVNAAHNSVDTAPPLKLVADFLLAAATAPTELREPTEPPATREVGGGSTQVVDSVALNFFIPEELLKSIANGSIALVRGRWIVALARSGGKLMRRQDLPPEAFVSIDELRKLVAALGDDWGLLFVAISYRWLEATHPDPDGFHLKIIAEVAEMYADTMPSSYS